MLDICFPALCNVSALAIFCRIKATPQRFAMCRVLCASVSFDSPKEI